MSRDSHVTDAACNEFWKQYPAKGRERSSKKQVAAEWAKQGCAGITVEVMAGVAAWKASAKWRDGFAEGAHRWLQRRQWENHPEPAQPVLSKLTRDTMQGMADFLEGDD